MFLKILTSLFLIGCSHSTAQSPAPTSGPLWPSINVIQGSSEDVATFEINRQAMYSNGSPGYVNSAIRASTTVGADAKAFEWSLLGMIDSFATGGENVGVYGQGYGRSSGPIWGMVAEAHAFGQGNAVGIEVNAAKPNGSNGLAIGIDIVNYGYMDAAIRVQPGVHALVSSADPNTYIYFTNSGGIAIVVKGEIVQDYE